MAASAAATVPAQTPAARLRQIGADALYLLLGFVMSIVAFTVWVTGVSLSLSLGLLIIGFPIVLATFACFRCSPTSSAGARRSCSASRSPPPTALRHPTAGSSRAAEGRRARPAALEGRRLPADAQRASASSGARVWLVLWGFALGSITLPAWWWAMPDDAEYLWFTIDTWEKSVGAAALGVALLPVALLLQRPLALSQAHIASGCSRPRSPPASSG